MKFLSCDWGTSTFRLRLVDAIDQTVLSEVKTGFGIASAFKAWKEAGAEEKSRVAFYRTYISEQVKKLTEPSNRSFHNTSIVLSGMASSSIGMLELPYKELPFQCNGSDIPVHIIPEGKNDESKLLIISGVMSNNDVIRGEETMLAGCIIADDNAHHLFIFPGTHSKHIQVKNGTAQSFTTYMTGELFNLLSEESILAASVKSTHAEMNDNDPDFVDGVIKGASSNIMNSIFHVRTNQLFKKKTPEGNYHYLSGLLIGHELKDAASNQQMTTHLVCSDRIKKPYSLALKSLGMKNFLHVNADEALIKGQLNIMKLTGY